MNWGLFSSKEGCTVFDLITKGLPRLLQARTCFNYSMKTG